MMHGMMKPKDKKQMEEDYKKPEGYDEMSDREKKASDSHTKAMKKSRKSRMLDK